MEPSTIALLAGIVFLFIAVVGGGFTLERLQVPAVPRWSRVVSGVLGVAFVAGFFYALAEDTEPERASAETPTPDPPSGSPDSDTGGPVELFRFPGPARSSHGLELTDFAATSSSSTLVVGDVVTLRFTLRNDTNRPIELEAFLAARNPDDANVDVETGTLTLPPGDTHPATADVTVDAPGAWLFWPCYSLASAECPSQWQRRVVNVGG